MIVENGTGDGGFNAKVDGFSRLSVRSTSSTQEAHAVSIGVGFAATTDTVLGTLTISAADSGFVYLLKNNSSSRPILLQKIAVSSDLDGVILQYVALPNFTTTTAKTTHVPINLNFGNNTNAEALAEYWDETGTTGIGGVTGGSIFETIELSTQTFVDQVSGAIRMAPGNSFGLKLNNPTASPAEVSINMRFFFEG